MTQVCLYFRTERWVVSACGAGQVISERSYKFFLLQHGQGAIYIVSQIDFSTSRIIPSLLWKIGPSEDTEALPSCSLSGASPPSTFTTSSPVSTLSQVAWCCLTATLVFLHFKVIVPWWGKEPQPSLSDYLLWLPVCCFQSVAKMWFSVE